MAEMMRIHDLKTEPEYFEATIRGDKPYEIRRNDRGFQVGDHLRLREYDRQAEVYSGREVTVWVTHILDHPTYLPEGYVALGVRVLDGSQPDLVYRNLEDLVELEYLRSIRLHGDFASAHEGWAVLKEELDELWDEVRKKDQDYQAMRNESVQIAAMGMKFALMAERNRQRAGEGACA